ncbi:MAG TPA: hypothetical protein VFG69_14945, partial [Nannocystaceae bacterium]|nr:hypothetical protein [Nannocystaceae bacterium]
QSADAIGIGDVESMPGDRAVETRRTSGDVTRVDVVARGPERIDQIQPDLSSRARDGNPHSRAL